jgi:hypothetical protein
MAKKEDLRARLRISGKQLDAINDLLLDPQSRVVKDFLAVVAKYGTPEEINAQANEAGKLENLMGRLDKGKSGDQRRPVLPLGHRRGQAVNR